MFVVAEYSLTEVFALMEAGLNRAVLPDGNSVKLSSPRLKMFYEKGVECVTCGLQGTVFRLESSAQETPHLNLYAVAEGKWVLMTKDHIHPKSKGGAEHMDNFQVMCQPCNGKKGCKVEVI